MQKQVMQSQPEQQQHQHHHHKPLEIEEISSSLSTQLLEFCNDELFPDTMPGSEVTSCSNCCLEDYNIDSSADLSLPLPLPQSTEEFGNVHQDDMENNNQSVIFYSPDDMDNDISASIDLSPSPSFSVPSILCTQDEQFEFSEMQPPPPQQPQFQLSNVVSNALQNNCRDTISLHPIVVGPHVFPSVYEDECLSSVPSYMAMNPSSPPSSLLSPGIRPYIPMNVNPILSSDGSGVYAESILINSDLQPQGLDFQADSNRLFCLYSNQTFSAHDLQGFCGESVNIVNGHGGNTPLLSGMFKVGKLSVEQRKEKIHKYMKKRNERYFSKKIKYVCRKTLADSRPRVRGRFAKNDELGENLRHACGNHDEEGKDEVVVVKEDEIIDSSDIFAHISGANSFKCSYPIHSWI